MHYQDDNVTSRVKWTIHSLSNHLGVGHNFDQISQCQPNSDNAENTDSANNADNVDADNKGMFGNFHDVYTILTIYSEWKLNIIK